jgi:2-haloalkanoic acid dehalogenase type II
MPDTICDAVLFDVGGTLLDVRHDPQQRALARVNRDGGVSLDAFRAGLKDAVTNWRRAGGEDRHEDLTETWVRHYAYALAAAGFAGDCTHAAQCIEESFLFDGWEVFSDALPLLDMLQARGITLGIISNWPATLEATLRRAGLRHYFSVVISSGVVGYTKPHSEIFRAAASQLELDPARLLYVGDSVTHDLHGATRAGLQAVLLDRLGEHLEASPRIITLTALESILDSRMAPVRPDERRGGRTSRRAH